MKAASASSLRVSLLKTPLTLPALAALAGPYTAHILSIELPFLSAAISLLSVTSPSVLHECDVPLGCWPSPALSAFGTREALGEHAAVCLILVSNYHFSVVVPTAAIRWELFLVFSIVPLST